MRQLIEKLEETEHSDGDRANMNEVSGSISDFQIAMADMTRKCGEAYMSALKVKGMFDRMEEIPSQFRKMYSRTMRIMDKASDAKKDAYQTQMELNRIRNRVDF